METCDWQLICEQIASLAQEEPWWVTLLANASALIMEGVADLNWAGFYLARERDGKPCLVLGPFQGKVACVTIPYGRGVCGTAAALDKAQLVPDVHAFPGHIACDGASRSEVVVPVHDGCGDFVGVLDVDSPLPARFGTDDLAGLTLVARTVGECARWDDAAGHVGGEAPKA